MECRNEFKFEFHSSTPWHGAVDQDWRSKMHAPKRASQSPDGSMLALVWQGCPLTLGSKPL